MNKVYSLGYLAGLKLLARPSAFIGFILIWLGLTSFTWRLADFVIDQALAAGLACAFLHYASELIHNLGHAWAARKVKHPMEGVMFWGISATSLYPADEKKVSPKMHIRRALGGPIASGLVTLITGIQLVIVNSVGDVLPSAIPFTALFIFWDNLLIFTLGTLLPLGSTDGSTILNYLKK
jgi:Zn-dependent protease